MKYEDISLEYFEKLRGVIQFKIDLKDYSSETNFQIKEPIKKKKEKTIYEFKPRPGTKASLF
jgi:hypothetical protein